MVASSLCFGVVTFKRLCSFSHTHFLSTPTISRLVPSALPNYMAAKTALYRLRREEIKGAERLTEP
jgi:hypothetical protein